MSTVLGNPCPPEVVVETHEVTVDTLAGFEWDTDPEDEDWNPLHVRPCDGLRQVRRAYGMTQKAMAAFLGVSLNTVCRWESGGGTPERTRAIRHAVIRAFGPK